MPLKKGNEFLALRRKRRISTQTINRKKQPTTTNPYLKPKKPVLKRTLTFAIIIVFVVAAGYFIYKLFFTELPFNQPEITEQVQETSGQQNPAPTETPSVENETQEPLFPVMEARIQIEVLNGCGEQGVANILSDRLKKYNYDVVNTGNFLDNGKVNFNVKKTKIIDQMTGESNPENARALADVIGIEYEQIETYGNPSPLTDLSVIIGKDFRSLIIFQKD